MTDNKKPTSSSATEKQVSNEKKYYKFGEITKFSLEEIEAEVLNDSVYLDVFAGSDIAFKKDVKEINSVIDDVLKLKPVSYFYDTDKFENKKFSNSNQIGLIANEVEQVFPHLVISDTENHRYLNYSMLTPILVKSIQELNHTINEQSKKIEELVNKIETLKKGQD